jgi:NAD(P)-dependent dehydrogenase (short-subunit alcohol dehydrogenase family)
VTDIAVPGAPIEGVEYHRQDVSDEAAWIDLITMTEKHYGRLDILVNNAGMVANTGSTDPETTPLEDWRRVFEVNADGVFLGCKHAVGAMQRSGGGSIINMSSIAALVPTPFITAYGASKAAVTHLTRSVALHCAERGYRIRCNSVHPGQVHTPMLDKLFDATALQANTDKETIKTEFLKRIPMGVFQEAEDIANAVLFLASDESRYITGTQIVVDGGMALTS